MVKRTREIEIVKDQGWYSQSEMKADLKWSSSGPYVYMGCRGCNEHGTLMDNTFMGLLGSDDQGKGSPPQWPIARRTRHSSQGTHLHNDSMLHSIMDELS